MLINNVQQARDYWLKQNPNHNEIDFYRSQSQHGGPPGLTHYVMEATDKPKDLKWVTYKKYWASPKICKINNIRLLPREDRNTEGETMKTDMLFLMKNKLDEGYKVTHITVMPDGRIFNFPASRIFNYVQRFDAYADHDFAGERGAAYYPLKLATEFDNLSVLGPMDKFCY